MEEALEDIEQGQAMDRPEMGGYYEARKEFEKRRWAEYEEQQVNRWSLFQ